MKFKLIKTEEIESIPQAKVKEFYTRHVNIGLVKYIEMLTFDTIRPQSAEGIYIYTSDGKKIYDFTGGMSVLGLGHNHPRILKARREFSDKKTPEVWKSFLSPYLAVLSRNLASIAPEGLNYSFFCNSGAEANEGALKIAEKYQGKKKNKIIYTDISYHGKTHATLSVSGCEGSREYFKLLDGCISMPYGDWQAFEKTIKECRQPGGKENDIIAIILEAIHAEGIIIPPEGYLKNIRRLCDENNILLIIDEVYCGFGRTGKMFAFEHEGVIPDIFTVSKSLGGGKASLAAYVVKDEIFKKAYGDMKDATVHTTTFNGLGEECCTAIEALNVIVEEGLVENSRKMGEYCLGRMRQLKGKYPNLIMDVRGIGLTINIELKKPAGSLIGPLAKLIPFLNDISEGFLTGVLMALLLHKYNILVNPGMHKKNFIGINPPLTVAREHIDYLFDALDELFAMNIFKLAKDYAGIQLQKRL